MGWNGIKQTNTYVGGGLGYLEKGKVQRLSNFAKGFMHIVPRASIWEYNRSLVVNTFTAGGLEEGIHALERGQAKKKFLQIHDLMALFSVSFEYADHRQCYHFLFYAKKLKINIIW